MSVRRFNSRAIGLSLAEAAIIFGGLMLALYLRFGSDGFGYVFGEGGAWMKITIATIFCVGSLFIYDLYSFTVVNDRRELVYRLMQALGTAWAALALLFYFAPELMIGRGVT